MVELGIGGLGPATEIGVGASSIVYRARQVDLDREVAIKVLTVTDDAFVRRFDREAKTLGKLSQNPGIVTVYDTGVNGAGQPYLILELCESSVLDHLKGSDGRYEPAEACRLASQVADAVAAAHTNGIAHRDIKPGNILISATGRAMVADFGISTVTGAQSQTNSVGFTAGYVAPETLNGGTAGTAADVYAVGATLFHMVAGRAPFVDDAENANLLALAQRVIKEPVPDLRTEGVPDEVCRIIEGAMAKLPQERPTAAQLSDQLKAVVKDLDAGASGLDDDALATVAAAPLAAAASATPPPPGSGVPDDATKPVESLADVLAAPGSATGGRPATGRPGRPGDTRSLPDESVLFPGRDLRTVSSTGVLGGGESYEPPRPPTAQPRVAFDDNRNRLVPLIIGAVAGLLALIVVGGFLVSRIGGDDATGDQALEAVEGPDATLSSAEDDGVSSDGSTEDDDDGSRGTLSPSTTGSSTTSSSTTTSTSAPTTTIKQIDLPNVVGDSDTAARRQLAGLGLFVNVVDEESDEPEGTVLRMVPGAGVTVDDGSTISIFVAKARPIPTVAVPDVTGKTQAEATSDLAAADLDTASAVTREFSSTVAKDRVISTTPPAGTTVNINTDVSLVLSDGFAPACPGIEGKTEAAAKAELEGKGLTVTTREAFSSSVPKGNVVSCSQADGSGSASLVISFGANPCTGAVGQPRATVVAALEAAGITVTEEGVTATTGAVGDVTRCTATTTAATVQFIESIDAPQVAVPDVVGRTRAAARAAILAADLRVGAVTEAFSDTVAEGRVISSDPAAGTPVDEDSTVRLTVSKGPEPTVTTTVPDVVGDTQAVATTKITDANLVVGTVTTANSDTVPAGQVISSDPPAGTDVDEGTAVNLIISDGPDDPPPTVAVPDVVGDTEAVATTKITAANLVVGTVTTANSDTVPAGQVISSDPPAGTDVDEGTAVNLIISDGPAETPPGEGALV